MKIHIIGCSGAGKSYLAAGLARKYNIRHYDLDELQWDNEADTYGVRMPLEKRAELLAEILDHDDWIIEGVYYAWCMQCFEDADIIYLLDTPKRVYKYRIIRRFVKRKLGLEKGKKETLKSLRELLEWTDTFQNVNMADIRKILEKYKDKTVLIYSGREVNTLIG
ncbi:MAG: DNA topology modulation protein FlaR [Clostridiales bacterium]|nr:DNA topology modulation protein FlaR [Clostridiales bacterium]